MQIQKITNAPKFNGWLHLKTYESNTGEINDNLGTLINTDDVSSIHGSKSPLGFPLGHPVTYIHMKNGEKIYSSLSLNKVLAAYKEAVANGNASLDGEFSDDKNSEYTKMNG